MSKIFDLANNLIKVSWSQIHVGQKKFLLKLYLGNLDLFEMMLFDIDDLQLFYLNQNSNEIEKQLKDLNPSLEAPVRKILQHLETCLIEKNEKSQYSISIQSEVLLIKMQSKLSGIKFNWEFKLSKMKNSHLKHHFVVPILFNCAEYQQRELELIKIIQAKDKELDDYKSQGIELTRKYLETEPFEISKFDNDLRPKSEIADLIEDPVQCLSTSLHQKVYQKCVEKYLALNFNSQSTESSNDLESSDMKNTPLNTAQRPSESETLSRVILINKELNVGNLVSKEKKRDEIEKVLEDENKSGPKINKKKKLFK